MMMIAQIHANRDLLSRYDGGGSYFHGKDGFNDVAFDDKPDVAGRVEKKENAVDAIRRIIKDNPGMKGQSCFIHMFNSRDMWCTHCTRSGRGFDFSYQQKFQQDMNFWCKSYQKM